MKITRLISALCPLLLFCFSCTTTGTKLIYTADQVKEADLLPDTVKIVRKDFRSDSLVVRLKNRKKLLLAPNAAWGMKTNGIIYRYHEGYFFKIRQLDSIIIYSKSNESQRNPRTEFFFSKKPDSEIFYLNEQNLKRQFPGDTCFLNAVSQKLKWYQTYHSFNRSSKSYRIVEFYRKCKQ